MELTKEKTEQQAALIGSIGMMIFMLDVDYCNALVKQMYDQISREASISVLNVNYSPAKAELQSKQAEALRHLCNYVSALKEVDELKKGVAKETAGREEIAKLFM